LRMPQDNLRGDPRQRIFEPQSPLIEDFPNLTTSAAKYSLVPAPQNPCATDLRTVFSQTLANVSQTP
jgi:hypothetical protein